MQNCFPTHLPVYQAPHISLPQLWHHLELPHPHKDGQTLIPSALFPSLDRKRACCCVPSMC